MIDETREITNVINRFKESKEILESLKPPKIIELPLSDESRYYIYPKNFWRKILTSPTIGEMIRDHVLFVTFGDYNYYDLAAINLNSIVGVIVDVDYEREVAKMELLKTPLAEVIDYLIEDHKLEVALFPFGQGEITSRKKYGKQFVKLDTYDLLRLDLRQR